MARKQSVSLAELRNMQEADLLKEIAHMRHALASRRMALRLGKEQGSHLLLAEKRRLAQMLTLLSERRRTSSGSPS